MMVMNDGNLFTIRHQQQQTQILEKIEINERVFTVFVKDIKIRRDISGFVKDIK